MSSINFTLPVSFLPGDIEIGTNPSKSIENSIKIACVRSEPSSLVSWGHIPQHGNEFEEVVVRKGHVAHGVVLGCTDGTLYIFHPAPEAKLDLISPAHMNLEPVDPYRPSSSRSNLKLSTAHSRSSSLSSARSPTLSPFQVSKSRIVSGLSVEQVEAPKNFVDFDDEPEKLKDMLKGRGGGKEKSMLDSLLPTFDKGVVLEKSEPSSSPYQSSHSTSKRKDDPRSHLLAGSNSPSLRTPVATSVPTSPMMLPASLRGNPYALLPKYHVFPQRFGPNLGISQVSMINQDQFFVCLQVQGYANILLLRKRQLILKLATFRSSQFLMGRVLHLSDVTLRMSFRQLEHQTPIHCTLRGIIQASMSWTLKM